MKKQKFQAFTLVELLIVVAILAVLATVGFVSYSNYLTGVRDTNRVTQLVGIRNAIETFKTTKDTPLPEEKIDIEVNGQLIAYQGIVGQNILNQIGLSDGGTDPKDETYFPYYLTRDRKYFQLMTFLEDEPDKEEELTFFPQTYASTDYSIRYPKVVGFPLGILTEKDTNTPLHEIESLTGTLDVMTASGEYVAHIQDNNMVSGTGGKLVYGVVALKLEGKTYTSCKNILERVDIASGVDGVYTINPTGSESFQVYCDMTTDGGGWILEARTSRLAKCGDFGWKSGGGNVYNLSCSYSLGSLNPSINILFSEILLGHQKEGTIGEFMSGGYIVKKELNSTELKSGVPCTGVQTKIQGTRSQNGGAFSMFNVASDGTDEAGNQLYNHYPFRDCCYPSISYGLYYNEYRTCCGVNDSSTGRPGPWYDSEGMASGTSQALLFIR